jgi:serine protease Do
MTRQTGALVGLSAVVSFLLGLVVAGTRPPIDGVTHTLPAPGGSSPALTLTTAATDGVTGATTDAPAGTPIDFASVAERINASVVNVDTASRGVEGRPRFSRRYSTTDPDAPREGSGSGFIIDPAGYILTNHHVIAGADRVTVTLSDGRAFRADVVGTDPAIDVALLHVQADGPLPAAPLGDSNLLRVGDWVCAIGNPLGVYAHSVTVGVVSFLGRKLFDQSLDNYIQTDAAISVGNSGGPLINSRGEVVGMTTAISSQAANIGFAIPMTQVIDILPQLREHGSVTRGSIGVGLTNLTVALRAALQLSPEHGALVQDVTMNTPASRAGLRAYDVVIGVDGRVVTSDEDLIRYIASQTPGTAVTLRVWREGASRDVSVRLAQRAVSLRAGRQPLTMSENRTSNAEWAPLGLRVRALDDEAVARLRLPADVEGVLVAEVDPAGPSQLANLRINHIILEINRRPVSSVDDYRRVVSSLQPGAAVALLVFDRATSQRILCTVIADPAS